MKYKNCRILIAIKNRVCRYLHPGLNVLLSTIFLIIFLFIITMAVTSRFNAHPDEHVQAEAVT